MQPNPKKRTVRPVRPALQKLVKADTTSFVVHCYLCRAEAQAIESVRGLGPVHTTWYTLPAGWAATGVLTRESLSTGAVVCPTCQRSWP